MRTLGIDYGRSRVGVAISDPTNMLARGLTVLRNSRSLLPEICELIRCNDVGTVVVGLPLTLRGEKGNMALEVERFARELAAASGVRIVTEDERYSSREAGETMIEMGVPRKRRREKSRVDLVAAAIILQNYLDAAKPGEPGGTRPSRGGTETG